MLLSVGLSAVSLAIMPVSCPVPSARGVRDLRDHAMADSSPARVQQVDGPVVNW